MRFRISLALLWILALGMAIPRHGWSQWLQQEFVLHPGWNSIFIEMQPDPKECDAQFAGLPVEGVWYYNSRVPTKQFYDDPAKMVLSRPEWMAYYPPSSPMRDATDLYYLLGGRAYLIKLGGTQDVVWRPTGRVSGNTIDWISGARNFAGFCVDEALAPAFADFFAPSPALAGQPVHRLSALTGKWEQANPNTAKMRRGEAFWIFANGKPDFQGPLRVRSQLGDGLEFGSKTVEIDLEITNLAAQKRTVTFRLIPSADAPTTTSPKVAGPVPLSYFQMDIQAQQIGWIPLPDSLGVEVESGQTRTVRFMVRRKDLAAPAPESGINPLYQSLLRISDGAGSLCILPVSTRGFGVGVMSPHPNMPYSLRMGLWVGTAQVNGVCEVNNIDDRLSPTAVSSPFSFPLLIHADLNWNVQLLSEVFVMSKPAGAKSAPKAQKNTQDINPSQLVLLTDRSLISQYEGVVSSGQELVGRRFSSAAFGTSPPNATQSAKYHSTLNSTQFPVVMSADINATSPTVTCTIVTDYDDPLNPFKHKYHPDHDNLSERFDALLEEGRESYQITRVISLEFTPQDPFGRASLAGWGDTIVGGKYTETVTGIHRYPIRSSGYFMLNYILGTTTLNDQ